jgi:hypothetical protein
LIFQFLPIATAGRPRLFRQSGVYAVMIVGLVLSLWNRDAGQASSLKAITE